MQRENAQESETLVRHRQMCEIEPELIAEHCMWSGGIQRIEQIRYCLISQLRTFPVLKQSIGAAKVFCAQILLENRAGHFPFDAYPSEFKAQMSNTLRQELRPFALRLEHLNIPPVIGDLVGAVYYNAPAQLHDDFRDVFASAAAFTPADWALSNTPANLDADKHALIRYKEEYIFYMQACIEKVERVTKRSKAKYLFTVEKMISQRDRYKQLCLNCV